LPRQLLANTKKLNYTIRYDTIDYIHVHPKADEQPA